MSAVHRALAVLPVAALVLATPSAHAAATIQTLPCVPYVLGEQTMPVVGAGFTPNGFVTVYTINAANPTPRILTSSQLDAAGAFMTVPAAPSAPGVTALTSPPPFTKTGGNLEDFTLVAEDKTNPAVPPIYATMPFQVVRFGLTTHPAPRKPRSRVTFTARGFTSGKPVYVHFRFGGKTRRTVTLGTAQGPCGIAEKRMRALPTKAHYGTWKAYVDQTKKFSADTLPQWIDSFSITRVFG